MKTEYVSSGVGGEGWGRRHREAGKDGRRGGGGGEGNARGGETAPTPGAVLDQFEYSVTS